MHIKINVEFLSLTKLYQDIMFNKISGMPIPESSSKQLSPIFMR